MSDLHALANAISDKSPAIKDFCLAVADRLDPPTASITGGHYVPLSAFPTVKAAGWTWAHNTVQPGDTSSIDAYAAAAKANGLRLVLGIYPYPWSYVNGAAKISAAGVQSLTRMSTHPEVMALQTYNEPYNLGVTVPQLLSLRAAIRTAAPNLKTWIDVGPASEYAPTVGNQKGICDYMGSWDYPFTVNGYNRASSLASLTRECAFIRGLGITPVWLAQTLADPTFKPGFVFPTKDQLSDYVGACKQLLQATDLLSMYVFDNAPVPEYTDGLIHHLDYLPVTV